MPGKPWGDGRDGNATVSSDPNTRATASGTANASALTIGSAILSDGDVFVIHQTRGTANVGKWEINKVASGGGTTSITCQKALANTYGTGAQVIKFTMYDEVTYNTHSIAAWNASTLLGGVEVVCGKTSIVATSQTITASALGFTKASSSTGSNTSPNYTGEGTTGAPAVQRTANGNGGGGGLAETNSANAKNASGGGGGGNGTAGTQVDQRGSDSPAGSIQSGGAGGGANTATDLTTIWLGGAGGTGGANNTGGASADAGGNGGGIVILITKTFTGGTINAIGGNGASATNYGAGGGGAGGSVLLVCNTATLGTITASGGSGGAQNSFGGAGGAGGTGIVAVHHSGTITGTTNPTFTDVEDATLKEGGGLITLL